MYILTPQICQEKSLYVALGIIHDRLSIRVVKCILCSRFEIWFH